MPYISAWWGKHASSKERCIRSRGSGSPPSSCPSGPSVPTTRSALGATTGLRTRRELEGTDPVELIEVRDIPGFESSRRAMWNHLKLRSVSRAEDLETQPSTQGTH